VAVLKGYDECAQLLRQQGAASAAELKNGAAVTQATATAAGRRGGNRSKAAISAAVNAWRNEMKVAVEAAAASASVEAEWWLADERELQERAAEIVRMTVQRATEQLAKEKAMKDLEAQRRREERRRAKAVRLKFFVPCLLQSVHDHAAKTRLTWKTSKLSTQFFVMRSKCLRRIAAG
jgi:hypothetical protein